MKGIHGLILFVLVFISTLGFSQTDFEPYFMYQEGAKVKIGHYNRRQIPLGYSTYTVSSVIETDSIDYLTIIVGTFDKYDKPLHELSFDAEFFEGQVSIDKLILLPIDSLIAIEGNEWDVMGRDLIIPSYLGVGIEVTSAWIELYTEDNKLFKASEFSRVVERFEEIETAAGNFDACMISSKVELIIGESKLYTLNTWFAKGIGPVRINYYNEKRKFVRYSEVIEVSLPDKS